MKRVLIVEDKHADLVAELCLGIFETTTATTLEEALTRLDGIDGVITDILFPRQQGGQLEPCGIEIAKECKRRGTPFQMATGHHEEGEVGHSFHEIFAKLVMVNATGMCYEMTGRLQCPGIATGAENPPSGHKITLAHICKTDACQWTTIIARLGNALGMDPTEVCRGVLEHLKSPGSHTEKYIAESARKCCGGTAEWLMEVYTERIEDRIKNGKLFIS